MKILRTPDSRFTNLEDYDFEPNYCTVPSGVDDAELRIHYIDAGNSDADDVILCMHGEPSWGYLYRKMIPHFVKAGFRVLVPDLVGFGRSDKPAAQEDYTYGRHLAWMSAWLEKVNAQNLTLVCQDWGGLIGLRLALAYSDRFRRIVAANTGLPYGQGFSEAFKQWLDYSQNVPEFNVGQIISTGTSKGLDDRAVAAYDAPYPDESYKAGARCFPRLVPITPEHDQAKENEAAWLELEKWDKPFLTAFSDGDPVTKGGEKIFQARVKGAADMPHTIIQGGGHFLQEDCGGMLAKATLDLIKNY